MGKHTKAICILVVGIAFLALLSSLTGLFSSGGPGEYEYTSINGESVRIYGVGLYKNDSVSVAAQGIASDLVTSVLGIPLLLLSLYFSIKGSFRAGLLLTGTLGYFLYTYMSYVFLWMYNRLFLVYVLLMALCLYAFILSMMSFDLGKINSYFKKGLPVRFLSAYQIFIALGIGMMWLGKIGPSVFTGSVPVGLEHYTTLVIQGMDLGIIVPTAILSAILLLNRKPFGYLLTSVIIFKSITMLTAISAMILNMDLRGIDMNPIEVITFSLFNLLAIFALVLLLKNTEAKGEMFGNESSKDVS